MTAPAKSLYRTVRDWFKGHIHSDDPMAKIANTGAVIVWTHLPFYPLLVLWLVGLPIWPSFVLWLSLPFFVLVPTLSTRHPKASRVLFAMAGVANTLLAVKAFGAASGAGWFLVPCLIIVAFFFRLDEWKVAGILAIMCLFAALVFRHLGAPLHDYGPEQSGDLLSLNVWCVAGLSAYLLFVAGRRIWKKTHQPASVV